MRNAQSRVKLVETERSSPPSKEAEKFFGDFLSRKSRPCGEQEKMQNADPSTAYAVPLPFQGRQEKRYEQRCIKKAGRVFPFQHE